MRHRHTPLLLALLIPCAVWAGQVFEWKDASGKPHFSDQPPIGVDAKPIGIKTNPPKPSGPPAGAGAQSNGAKTWTEKNDDFAKRKAEEQDAEAKAREEDAQNKRKQEACDSAKAQLKLLESGRRVQRMDEKGERVVLDDAAREQEMARIRENMKQACEN